MVDFFARVGNSGAQVTSAHGPRAGRPLARTKRSAKRNSLLGRRISRLSAPVLGIILLGWGALAASAGPAGAVAITSVTTVLSPPSPVTVGTAVTDQTALSGTNTSTVDGFVTYSLYGDSGCSNLLVSLGTDLVVTNGVIPPSAAWVATQPGDYWFQASFRDPGFNVGPVLSACGSEQMTVLSPPVPPAVVTTTTTTPPAITTTTVVAAATTTTLATRSVALPVVVTTTPSATPGPQATTPPATTAPKVSSAPSTTVPTRTTTPRSVTTTTRPVTTTTIAHTTTSTPGQTPTTTPKSAGKIPLGAPQTGAGGTAGGSSPLLMRAGLAALIGAIAAGAAGLWHRRGRSRTPRRARRLS